jgi:bifunctional NMN adenylyltransferase/nudix hydrolase
MYIGDEAVIDEPIHKVINPKIKIKENMKEDKLHSTGVIVARFQCATLHGAYKEVIQTVLDKHPKVLILLGLSPIRGSINDPLDFQPRKQMIIESFPHEKYPNLTIGYVKDQRENDIWSEKVDDLIRDQLGPNDSAVIYGGRETFLTHYVGKYETQELHSDRIVSELELKGDLLKAPQSHSLFRAGAIWASGQRYPTVYSTVDIAVVNRREYQDTNTKENSVLLAKKPNETKYRFVGGFVDIKDESVERAALRELREETTLSTGLAGLRYVGSTKIDDWRYRANKSEKIMTHFYVAYYSYGSARASDDIQEVRWINIEKFTKEYKNLLVDEHIVLGEMLVTWFENNKE